MLQRGQSGSGEALHVFGRHCCPARFDDINRWSECDFLPTSAVQGVCQRVRQPTGSAQAQIVQPQVCQRERETELPQWPFKGDQQLSLLSHKESSAQWHESATLLWKLRPLASPCESQSARDRRAPTTGSTYYAYFHHSTSRK